MNAAKKAAKKAADRKARAAEMEHYRYSTGGAFSALHTKGHNWATTPTDDEETNSSESPRPAATSTPDTEAPPRFPVVAEGEMLDKFVKLYDRLFGANSNHSKWLRSGINRTELETGKMTLDDMVSLRQLLDEIPDNHELRSMSEEDQMSISTAWGCLDKAIRSAEAKARNENAAQITKSLNVPTENAKTTAHRLEESELKRKVEDLKRKVAAAYVFGNIRKDKPTPATAALQTKLDNAQAELEEVRAKILEHATANVADYDIVAAAPPTGREEEEEEQDEKVDLYQLQLEAWKLQKSLKRVAEPSDNTDLAESDALAKLENVRAQIKREEKRRKRSSAKMSEKRASANARRRTGRRLGELQLPSSEPSLPELSGPTIATVGLSAMLLIPCYLLYRLARVWRKRAPQPSDELDDEEIV